MKQFMIINGKKNIIKMLFHLKILNYLMSNKFFHLLKLILLRKIFLHILMKLKKY